MEHYYDIRLVGSCMAHDSEVLREIGESMLNYKPSGYSIVNISMNVDQNFDDMFSKPLTYTNTFLGFSWYINCYCVIHDSTISEHDIIDRLRKFFIIHKVEHLIHGHTVNVSLS